MRSYTVVGAGAIGLLYGSRLAAAGHPVRWVVRSGADEMRAAGLEVRSVDGDLRIEAAAMDVFDDPSDAPASDVVVVALKTTANEHLADLVGPAVADGATVAVFQNGLGVEARVRHAMPQAGAVVGAMCFVCAHRRSAGIVDHLDYGAVTAGVHGESDPRAAVALVDDLIGTGTEATIVADLAVARWRKLVWNVPFNGLSVILGATTDALLGAPATRGLVADLMDEVIGAANAAGHAVAVDFRDEMLATTDAMAPYAPSMKLDHEGGRPMEIEAIYDAPLDAALRAGAPMPKVAAVRDQLRFLDRRHVVADRHG